MIATPFDDYLYAETRIRVCEEVGPNSPDYDYLMDKYLDDEEWGLRVYDRWLNHVAQVARHQGLRYARARVLPNEGGDV